MHQELQMINLELFRIQLSLKKYLITILNLAKNQI